MTDATLDTAEPAPPRDPAKPTPGEYLRKLREEKGYTHAVVGSALHLTAHYIKALEGDDYGKLPGLTFVKGYLRSYARFLGADVDNVVARFDEHIAGLLDEGMHTARVQRSRRRQDQALRWAIGAGFVVVAGLVAGWWFMSDREVPAAAQSVASTQQPVSNAITTTAVVPPARSATPPAGTFAPTTPAVTSYPTGQAQTLRAIPEETVTAVPMSQGIAAGGLPAATVITDGAPAAEASVTSNAVTTDTTAAANTAADDAPDATSPPVVVAEQGTVTATQPTAAAPTAANAATITPNANGARQVSLVSSGDDELRVTFNGNSWIEVDDGHLVRLYNDMLSAGDTLTIRGEAPFHVLLGDASRVAISVNATAIDISADIRDDSTARLTLNAPAAAEAPL